MVDIKYKVEKAPISIFFLHIFLFVLSVFVIVSNNMFFEFQTSEDRSFLTSLIYLTTALSFLLICFYTTIDTTLKSRNNYSKGVSQNLLKLFIFLNLLLGIFVSYQFAIIQTINKLL